MRLTFSDFSPSSFAFEVRYPEAYLLWDRAGQVAEDLRTGHEITRRLAAEPGRIAFDTETTREVSWHLDRPVVIDHQPQLSKVDAFYSLAADCLEMTLRHLGVSELKRVGFRPIFAKKFASKEEAAATLLSLGLVNVPKGKNLNIDPLQRYPEYAMRCEDEKLGYMIRISLQEVNYELEFAPQWKGGAVEPRHEDHLTLDVDYYSRAVIPVGSFRVEEWLAQVLHAVRRDADSYLLPS